MANLLVKQGKPLIDGELIKSCLTVEVKEMCPGKINFLKTISLSTWTVAHRDKDIGSNINSHLKNRANDFPWFSLTLDSSQMLPILFSCCLLRVNAEVKALEELACMGNLYGTTADDNISKVNTSSIQPEVESVNMLRICTTQKRA